MGLFDEQIEAIRVFEGHVRGRSRTFKNGDRPPWPRGESLILEDDTGLELGNPRTASISILIWCDPDLVRDGTIVLVGPDVGEADAQGLPFAQVLLAGGVFGDDYESYREIRDAVYDTHLEGFTVRTMPSRSSVWCRVSSEAASKGFSLADLGGALIESLKSVDTVTSAEAIFVTSKREDVEALSEAAGGARRVVDAMMKMYQERNFDCTTCEYREVCDSVEALKVMREKLTGGRR